MSRFELLVGSGQFWDRARGDIAAAQQRVLVQAMTFEGDAAGLGVARAIAAATALDRRVLVDDYSRNVINDTMLPLPFRPPGVLAEARRTLAMFDELVAERVGVRITNPVLGHPLRYPLRNHKKLLVMDDVAYVGGINFSDHNFAWHDLMLRIEGAEVAEFFAADFARDWQGRPAGATARFDDLELISLDGETNAVLFEPLLTLVSGAKRSVEMISAYPTMPFVEAMAEAARGGAKVDLYTPAPNNKPVIRDYLSGVAGDAGIALHLLPEMTHAKALLIDREALVLGSSNFNFASFRVNSDIVAVVRNPELIAQFETQLLGPARATATPVADTNVPKWRQLRGILTISIADAALARLSHGPVRAIDWPSA
ncbi:MAG TPA: phosphatidylserine/phosphatidylglycerophosphate/cardiolipin synthase family protein [Novosphingobium sp.]|nr:phosphatidylserine/phosphatidylglycerophosphate/cardiolipin synthase family protein [Novosphingobium sp.]